MLEKIRRAYATIISSTNARNDGDGAQNEAANFDGRCRATNGTAYNDGALVARRISLSLHVVQNVSTPYVNWIWAGIKASDRPNYVAGQAQLPYNDNDHSHSGLPTPGVPVPEHW